MKKAVVILLSLLLIFTAGCESEERAIEKKHKASIKLMENVKHDANINMVISNIKKGADLNWTNDDGETPLLKAVRCKNLDIIELLLSKGADVNAPVMDILDSFVLKFPEHKPIYDTFYDWADQKIPNSTVLFTAAYEAAGASSKSNSEYQVLKLLLEHGADPNIQNNKGQTALHICSGVPGSYSSESERLESAKLLVEYGADVDIADNYDNTPLHWGAKDYIYGETLIFLIEHSSNIDSTNYMGDTPLLVFSKSEGSNRKDVIEAFLNKGADVTIMNNRGKDISFYNDKYEKKSKERKSDSNKKAIETTIEGGPRIGMHEVQVVLTEWGKPNKINKTTTSYGVTEQWVYGSGRYVYLENGYVTAIQE